MKDIEMRGIILKKYYERRREGMIQLEPEDFDKAFTNPEICHISKQLGAHGLVKWKSVGEIGSGNIGGFGEITAFGIDIIEKGPEKSPIEIVIDSSQYNISGSSNVQIGTGNIQNAYIDVEKINSAINGSEVSSEEKEKAKSLLQKFLDNPLVKVILGKMLQ